MVKYTVDAKDKTLGRLATEVAVLLRGKNDPKFVPYRDSGNTVEVLNSDKFKVSGKKAGEKMYWHYSRYPGGIKGTSYESLRIKNHAKIIQKAVYGMLPKNKLRFQMIKRLIVK